MLSDPARHGNVQLVVAIAFAPRASSGPASALSPYVQVVCERAAFARDSRCSHVIDVGGRSGSVERG